MAPRREYTWDRISLANAPILARNHVVIAAVMFGAKRNISGFFPLLAGPELDQRFFASAQNDTRDINKRETNLWQGIDPAAQNALSPRDYRTASFAQSWRNEAWTRANLSLRTISRAKTSVVIANSHMSPVRISRSGPLLRIQRDFPIPSRSSGQHQATNSQSYTMGRAKWPTSNSRTSAFP